MVKFNFLTRKSKQDLTVELNWILLKIRYKDVKITAPEFQRAPFNPVFLLAVFSLSIAHFDHINKFLIVIEISGELCLLQEFFFQGFYRNGILKHILRSAKTCQSRNINPEFFYCIWKVFITILFVFLFVSKSFVDQDCLIMKAG